MSGTIQWQRKSKFDDLLSNYQNNKIHTNGRPKPKHIPTISTSKLPYHTKSDGAYFKRDPRMGRGPQFCGSRFHN